MKKTILLTLGLTLIGTGTLLFFQDQTFSQDVTTKIASQCASASSQSCCMEYQDAIETATQDWEGNLQKLIDQQIPASDMVDDAYENLRTYNCWLDYICRSVQYSGYAPIESALGTGLTSEHIGQAPGCENPENLKMESNYSSFVERLKQTSLEGTSIVSKDNFYQNDKINFFPGCMTDKANNNKTPVLTQISNNYQSCKNAIEAKFGCDANLPLDEFQNCVENSRTVTVMETALKKAHADQKASALENKLADIVTKLQGTETHAIDLANFITQLDQRLACIAQQCT